MNFQIHSQMSHKTLAALIVELKEELKEELNALVVATAAMNKVIRVGLVHSYLSLRQCSQSHNMIPYGGNAKGIDWLYQLV